MDRCRQGPQDHTFGLLGSALLGPDVTAGFYVWIALIGVDRALMFPLTSALKSTGGFPSYPENPGLRFTHSPSPI